MYEVRDGGAPNTGPTIKFRFSEKAKNVYKNLPLVLKLNTESKKK